MTSPTCPIESEYSFGAYRERLEENVGTHTRCIECGLPILEGELHWRVQGSSWCEDDHESEGGLFADFWDHAAKSDEMFMDDHQHHECWLFCREMRFRYGYCAPFGGMSECASGSYDDGDVWVKLAWDTHRRRLMRRLVKWKHPWIMARYLKYRDWCEVPRSETE